MTHICLEHTTQIQSVVRLENSLHPLHTRRRHARHGAPRFIIRPNSMRHLAHDRLLSTIIGRSSEPLVFSAPFFLRL